ncbi:MAG: NAD(P)-dependent alcohol dehydrogenase [Actinomycetota bacterium]|nr:NAD(P)-dependent alcohol dehydrogenase [Actinomycetota bacterium]
MKAIVQDHYGSADVLELQEIDTPVADDDGVLVRVEAASVNPLDWHIMRGSPFLVRMMSGLRQPKPRVRGVDVAGQIEAVGKNVTQFQPGDEVFGWCQGAFAEYVSAGEQNFLTRPGSLTHEQAAAVGVAGFTALQGLRDKGRIQPGHKVLVIGASGGVGTFAVQIAKSYGAEVTGVCRTANTDMVRSIGADHVIDYTREDFTQGHQRYDLIFQLAGTASPSRLRRVLTPKGTLVLSAGTGRLAGIDRVVRALVVSPFVSQRLVTWVASENHEDLVTLKELMESGKVTPVIDRSYPLHETPEAIRYVEDGHTRGKVVITM